MVLRRESAPARHRRARAIVRALKKLYPDAKCALHHENAYQLVAATILSAQCTDTRVNLVTPALFRKYPSPKELSAANDRELESIIRSTGFFRNKAKSLKGMARVVLEKFNGKIPSTMAELLELPGVARKTANVVLGVWFGKAEGVVVDTHVQRLSGRLGLTVGEDPKEIEKDLMQLLPKDEWIQFSHNLIWHGRQVCVARNPRCQECGVNGLCPSAGMFHVEQGRRT